MYLKKKLTGCMETTVGRCERRAAIKEKPRKSKDLTELMMHGKLSLAEKELGLELKVDSEHSMSFN